jgi:hypothetical protein
MSSSRSVIQGLAGRLELPQPARSRVLIEVAADLADLEAAYLARGATREQAREQAAERLDLSDEAIRELVRVHGSPMRRFLDRFSEQGRRRGERLALGAVLLFLIFGTRALVPSRTLLTDAGPAIWVISALAIPGLLLAIAKAYSLWGRDEHDPRRLRTGLDFILLFGGLSATVGLALWWLGLRRVATAAVTNPEGWFGYVLDWLTHGSALVLVSFQAAILLGVIWLILSGRVAQTERGEAELLLFEAEGQPKGGER